MSLSGLERQIILENKYFLPAYLTVPQKGKISHRSQTKS